MTNNIRDLKEFRKNKNKYSDYPKDDLGLDNHQDISYNKNKEGDDMSELNDKRIDMLIEMQKDSKQDMKEIENRMDKRLRDYTAEANEREKRYLEDSRERENRYRTKSQEREERLNKKFEIMMESNNEFKVEVKEILSDIKEAENGIRKWTNASLGTFVAIIITVVIFAITFIMQFSNLINNIPK